MCPCLVIPPVPGALDPALWESVYSEAPRVTKRSPNTPIAPSGSDDTVLIVPAAALSWHRVSLPRGLLGRNGQVHNSTRLRAVLEGVLEDQLLDEPAELHFALQPYDRESALLWVAVCKRRWLREVLDALTKNGHKVIKIVPEWSPAQTGRVDHTATLWFTGEPGAEEMVWVDDSGVHRRIVTGGMGECDQNLTGLPADIPVFAEPAFAQIAENILSCKPTVMHRAQRFQSCLENPWNLAQAEFTTRNALLRSVSDAAQSFWQASAWRPVRWAMFLLLGVNLVGLNLVAWHARQTLTDQRAAIQSILLTNFPNTVAVVDAPLQMQRAVDSMGRGSGEAQIGDFERLLEAFGSVVPDGAAPTSIEFSIGELRIPQWTAGAESGKIDVELLRPGLESRGYRARIDDNALVITP